ncbi:unnamed protein product (macronuclear) [Paramecium tetraurelia]|uniref:Uncharacterized protein n=1 Tax=Paramecium tetraurelia TaxID=5888 RepID=A0EE17_PARTE|nr:uncharacterized protein GSPATT00025878001 [Paramecium tetraurelia]CAK93534.1 unnamed protein product [Paramecium tetraurelia]|eukprot:XP_001460931.1 hypothetical protein (macronuclear) [Paramecium tetraurelia strain d4-2]
MNYPQLNLQQFYMLPTTTYALQTPKKETCDQASQFPEPSLFESRLMSNTVKCEEAVEKELKLLLIYLSKNISLLKDSVFDEFVFENLRTLSSLQKDLPDMIKQRYILMNKTKEEMTKFIIRRCFLFIKSQIHYEEKEGFTAEERDRMFYNSFFSDDKEFMKSHLKESIDDMIPFRKDSKMKTMNDIYLKRLFESERFSKYYSLFLTHFKDICMNENEEKIQNMSKQFFKIIVARDYGKIKTYRRFPWKDHELVQCQERAKTLYSQYSNSHIKKTKNKFHSKCDSHYSVSLEKSSQSQN